MYLRKSNEKDLREIMKIISQAQAYFKENEINQWQNNYPNIVTIISDINKNESYVLVEQEDIIATSVISFNGEKNYENIYNGQWLTNEKFAVIHRIAVSNNHKGKGIAAQILKYVESMCREKGINSIKIDTHEDNISMQKLLKKSGFKYCGIILLEDRSERIAFEKLIL